MKIPTVKMQVPVFTEREYAPTPASVNPEQEIDVKIREHEVSLEYAAFLINEGKNSLKEWYEFDRTEYIDELFEAFVYTDFGRALVESLTSEIVEGVQLFTEKSITSLIKGSLNRMLDNAIENDKTDVRDWI